MLVFTIILLAIFGFWKWDSMVSTINTQKIEIVKLSGDLTAKKLELKLSNFNLKVVTKRFNEEEALNKVSNEDLQGISNAPDSEDGPIAPILRNTLNRLNVMR